MGLGEGATRRTGAWQRGYGSPETLDPVGSSRHGGAERIVNGIFSLSYEGRLVGTFLVVGGQVSAHIHPANSNGTE